MSSSKFAACALALASAGAWATDWNVNLGTMAGTSFQDIATRSVDKVEQFTDLYSFDVSNRSSLSITLSSTSDSSTFTRRGGVTGTITTGLAAFHAFLDNVPLVGTLSTVSTGPGSTTSTLTYDWAPQIVAAASHHVLKVTGDGGTSGGAYANGRITLVAAPLAVPVPEPETYALMLAGLGVIGLLARRRHVR